MKISELVDVLNGVKVIHGDIQVAVSASPKTDLYLPGVEAAVVTRLPFIWNQEEEQMMTAKAPVLVITATEECQFAWEVD